MFYALALNEAADLVGKNYTNQLKAAAILQSVGQKQPDHPGVAHYLIHSYDFAPLAARCLPIARHYGELAPAAPHALHMPSHIYSMLGMWDDSIASNIAAEAAARNRRHKHFLAKDIRLSRTCGISDLCLLADGAGRTGQKLVDAVPQRTSPCTRSPSIPASKRSSALRDRPGPVGRGRTIRCVVEQLSPCAGGRLFHPRHRCRANGRSAAARGELARLGELKAGLVQSHDEYWTGQTEIQIRSLELGSTLPWQARRGDLGDAEAADLETPAKRAWRWRTSSCRREPCSGNCSWRLA